MLVGRVVVRGRCFCRRAVFVVCAAVGSQQLMQFVCFQAVVGRVRGGCMVFVAVGFQQLMQFVCFQAVVGGVFGGLRRRQRVMQRGFGVKVVAVVVVQQLRGFVLIGRASGDKRFAV